MDLYAIWSERNNAVSECSMAIAEKRQAMVDRDIAIRQRDAAFFDRDNAIMQRDNAIARLRLKTSSMNAASSGVMHNPTESGMIHNQAESGMIHNQAESGMIHNQAESCVMHNQGESGMNHNPPESGMVHNQAESSVSVSQGMQEKPMVQKQLLKQRKHPIVNYSEIAFKPVEVPFSDVFAQSTTPPKSAKSKKGKHAKETKTASTSSKALKLTRETKIVSSNKVSRSLRETKTVSSTKALKPTRKISKRGTRNSNKQATVAVVNHPSSKNGTDGKSSNFEKQHGSKDELSLKDLGLDCANLPVPFCSCTGNPQSCYKWGKGGWQSACCTTTLSVYPLPQMPNKRHSRMGGRKMSGGAFTKLITRLASEGHNVTAPVDLKNHWARHGTNRYIIIR